MSKLLTYSESFLSLIVTILLNITFASVLSVLASIFVIIRTLYLMKRDVDINHKGNITDWLKAWLKKN
jgi:hypothetical protein